MKAVPPGMKAAIVLGMSYKGRGAKTWGQGYTDLPDETIRLANFHYHEVRDKFSLLYSTPRAGMNKLSDELGECVA